MTALSEPAATGTTAELADADRAARALADPSPEPPPSAAPPHPTSIPREVRLLQAGGAAASAALIAVSVVTISPWGADVYAFAPTAALCAIIAAFAGAQRRFGALARATGWQFWGGALLGLASLGTVIALGVSDHRLSPGAALLAGVGYFAAMGIQPLALARGARSSGLPQERAPEPRARMGAAVFALAFGGLIWIMAAPLGRDTLHLALLLAVLAVTLPFPWGLARAARSWRRRQWVAFGISLTAMAVAGLGAPLAGAAAEPLGIGAGIVAASALLWATAIRPGSGSSPVASGEAPDADEPREALAA